MKRLVILVAALFLVGCAGEFSSEDALSTISAQSEFSGSFVAPLHIGREVLTAENHKSPQGFIDSKYGNLVRAGLVQTSIGEKNSWRTLLDVTLTDKGREMVDKGRTERHFKATGEDHVFYVAVCRLVPERVLRVDTVGVDTMRVMYDIVERDITSFGEFLGFVDGRGHSHSRSFVRGSFSWSLVAVEP